MSVAAELWTAKKGWSKSHAQLGIATSLPGLEEVQHVARTNRRHSRGRPTEPTRGVGAANPWHPPKMPGVPDRRTPMPRCPMPYLPSHAMALQVLQVQCRPAHTGARARAKAVVGRAPQSTRPHHTPDASPNSRAPNRSAGHPQSVRACVRQTCVRMRGLVPGPQLTTFHVSSAHKHLTTLVSRTQNLAISATGMRTSSSCRCS